MSTDVCVIVPAYNSWPLVRRAVDSVLRQTEVQVECIVVDDASTDGTAGFLFACYADRVSVLSNATRRGPAASRNRGVHATSAGYVAFLDSDDELTPRSLASRLSLFQEDTQFQGVAFGSRCDDGGAGPGPAKPRGAQLTIVEYAVQTKWLSTNSFLLRRETMLSQGMYCEALCNGEDKELFLRLLRRCEFRSCGEVVTQVHCDGRRRARNDFVRLLTQGLTLSQRFGLDSELRACLGAEFDHLLADDHANYLRALYHAGAPSEFRRRYRVALASGLIPSGGPFRRRFLLSYLRQLLPIGAWRRRSQ